MSYTKKTDKNKPWAYRAEIKRETLENRVINKFFLIYCEGKNTEPFYFSSFPMNSETKVEALGLGRSRTSLVEKAIELCAAKKILPSQINYDEDREIWCVFDKDTKGERNEDADFNFAISKAKTAGLNVAYSNDSFELWYLLHDKFIDVRLTRREYYKYLSSKFGINYEKVGKNKSFAISLYNLYLPHQHKAIANSKKLHDLYKGEKSHCKKNPCTTVYKLVKQLNKFIRK